MAASHEAEEYGIEKVAEQTALDRASADLSPKERELLVLEKEINANLDAQLEAKGSELLWPWACYFIVPNEFGERFAFYGVKPLFARYLTSSVGLNAVSATIWTSNFTAMAYFFPLGGAALSDSFLGKYVTIVSLSVIYAIGLIFLAVFSVPGLVGYSNVVGENGSGPFVPFWTWLFPVILISIGTGGIKPCVSAHGGDQYLPHQKKGLDFFFSIFYVAINCGALISGYLTPYLKNGVSCFGHECYFISYIVCAAVFVVAMILFAIGKPFYRIVPPRGEFLPYKALKGSLYAAFAYITATKEERASKRTWLDFAEPLVGEEFVVEIQLFGNIILMILPTLFFWMCYDQGSNEWQFQYDMMYSTGIPAEAFGQLNTIFVIIMVPLASMVYRWLERKQIRVTILQRMGSGFFLLTLSYVISGILQVIVIRNYDPVNDPDCLKCVNGWWQVPQWFILSLGETFFSPEGLKLVYTNSGKQLRAQSASLWLVMSALGDLVTSAVNTSLEFKGNFNDLSSIQAISNPDRSISLPNKFWLFSSLCFVFNIWFVFWAKFFFKYKDESASMTSVPKRSVRKAQKKALADAKQAVEDERSNEAL